MTNARSRFLMVAAPCLLSLASCAADAPPEEPVPNACENLDGAPEESNVLLEAPPEDCFPKCLWDLVGPCSRGGCCYSDNTGSGCYADGSFRWSKINGTETIYKADGSVCYSTTPTDSGTLVYKDATGNPVAEVGATVTGHSALCDGKFYDFRRRAECPPLPRTNCAYGSCSESN